MGAPVGGGLNATGVDVSPRFNIAHYIGEQRDDQYENIRRSRRQNKPQAASRKQNPERA